MRKIILTATILSLLICSGLHAQDIEVIPTIPINAEFYDNTTDFEQSRLDTIIEQLQLLFDKYATVADFVDPSTGEISADKSIVWSDLFTPGALIIDDLKKKATTIHNADYADNVYEFFEGEGVSFDIQDLVVEEIGVNASGYIFAKVTMLKLVRSYYNDGVSRYDSKGRKVNMLFDIEIPPYDLTYGKITKISGEIDEVVDKYSLISLTPTVGIGSFSVDGSDVISYDNSGSVSSINYGLGLLYRYGIGNNRKLFITLGAGADLITIKNKEFEINASGTIGTSTVESYLLDDNGVSLDVSSTNSADLFPTLINNANSSEEISGVRLVPRLGVSYKLIDKTDNNFYIDLLFTGNYTTGFTGGTRTVTGDGVVFPQNPNFPSFVELQSNDLEFGAYTNTISSDSAKNIESNSNFSYGVAISPVFQKDININWGIEIAAEYYYGLNSFFKHEQKPTLDLDNDNTYLENYTSSAKLSNINLKIGIYYEFGKGR